MVQGGFTPRRSDLRTLRWVDRWDEDHPGGRLSLPTLVLLLVLAFFEVCLSGTRDEGFQVWPKVDG